MIKIIIALGDICTTSLPHYYDNQKKLLKNFLYSKFEIQNLRMLDGYNFGLRNFSSLWKWFHCLRHNMSNDSIGSSHWHHFESLFSLISSFFQCTMLLIRLGEHPIKFSSFRTVILSHPIPLQSLNISCDFVSYHTPSEPEHVVWFHVISYYLNRIALKGWVAALCLCRA